MLFPLLQVRAEPGCRVAVWRGGGSSGDITTLHYSTRHPQVLPRWMGACSPHKHQKTPATPPPQALQGGMAGGGVSEELGSCRPQTLPLLVGVQATLPRSDQPISRCRSESFRDMLHIQQCRLVLPSPSPSSCRGLPPHCPMTAPQRAGLGKRLRGESSRQPGASSEAMATAWLGTAPKIAWGFPFLVFREQGSSMGAGTRLPLFVTKGGGGKGVAGRFANPARSPGL